MSPRLRVLAGPSLSSLQPIEVNSDKSFEIVSDVFEGKVLAYIKDFTDAEGKVLKHDYFQKPERKDVSWSIQVQGRFLEPQSADDILFGNTFDHPLNLPWGSGAALKLMKYVDPTLEHDLTSQTQPWALSPLISTMPYLAYTRSEAPAFPPLAPLNDDTSQLYLAATDRNLSLSNASERRSYFTQAKRRREIVFGPEDVLTTDFCYGYLEFNPSLALKLPGGLSIDLMRYWDGQQVRFVCCKRRKPEDPEGEDGMPWGRIFWCVAIELVKDRAQGEGHVGA
ncbi:DUF1769-domain-containing protein [Gloeophyllum trabeum ATCC 11539]|uniref:DUF1769-domain-containing protein n=1 Tax=Gloeophyllum trabeum (strain ATCC 11539 / FP-39264 / Madison 617) TaxID=670483 RepID=S7PX62_GLOTA|nr:DUF1769-domain-containing protein [Gloeophyllum trabeum ATCC 11539]EPQ52186.1 DUF1769-domain-containing protein [Gloeophyllum trabeum ATCC 11539]